MRLLFEGGTLDSSRIFAGGAVANGIIQETPDGVVRRLERLVEAEAGLTDRYADDVDP